MEDNISELVERLGSDEDAVRKMAVFKLQSSIGDPSFADIFIAEGGLTRLRYLTLHASGNTLAYSLTSFARLLEVDKGWEFVDQEVVERVCIQINARLPVPGLHQPPSTTSYSPVYLPLSLDCRAYSNPPVGEYTAWRNVHPSFCCIPSLYQRQQCTAKGDLRVSSLETGDSYIPTILGDACQPTLLCRSCALCQCAPVDQFPYARLDHE